MDISENPRVYIERVKKKIEKEAEGDADATLLGDQSKSKTKSRSNFSSLYVKSMSTAESSSSGMSLDSNADGLDTLLAYVKLTNITAVHDTSTADVS